MKLYGLSGLGADKRVFKYLNLECELVPIEWINPIKNEGIKDYAHRLSNCINEQEPFGIIGVSFGGLIAVEMSKIISPKLTILISSAETRNELRGIYKIISKAKFLQLIPSFLFNPPRFLAHWVFGAKYKKLLNEILDDTDLKFAKWAVQELVGWKNIERLNNPLLKIGGSKDKLIPSKNDDVIIKDGQHFMIVDEASKISNEINKVLRKLSN